VSLRPFAALVAAVAVASAPAASARPAGGGVFLAPIGSDAAPCTAAAPCQTLRRGLELASGGVVWLAPGRYPSQTLSGGGSRLVTFRPTSGRVVLGGRLTIAQARNVKLVNFSFPRSDPQYELLFEACNTNVTLVGSTGRRFVILEGNSHITFAGGSWGGYGNPGDEDSAIGTAGATGPERRCGGSVAPPAHAILFDHFTWHDVFWRKTVAQWGGSHPDCFEINGYANGVTIADSLFLHCQDSFLAIYTNQGDVSNVTVRHTTFRDLGDTTWYGSQWRSGDGHACGSIVFTGNTWLPNNPDAHYPYSSILAQCAPGPGQTPVRILDNTFQRGPVSQDCANSIAPPYRTMWAGNTFVLGSPCTS
jgi:hypothetical protein